MNNINELRKRMESTPILMEDKIAEDYIRDINSQRSQCTIHHGLDIVKVWHCDSKWKDFNETVVQNILQSHSPEDAELALQSLSLEDHHWEWMRKAVFLRAQEYKWFFLVADGETQAACLIYQPKASTLEPGDIFYIEYVATAPWNRPNPYLQRYKGVVPVLIKHVVHFANTQLGLRLGFSLHALPGACKFYERIGMQYFPAHDKDGLRFYELSSAKTNEFLEAK